MKATKYAVIPVLFILVGLIFAACDNGTNPVSTSTAATPTANPPAGNYSSAQSVSLSTTTSGASIYYNIDGTPSFTLYTGPISVSATTILKAFAAIDGMTTSNILTAIYTITPEGQVVQPIADPPGGSYGSAQSVSLSTATAGASIYYTLDGATPTSSSTLYTGPITISATGALRAIAVKGGMTNSSILTAAYTITLSAGKIASVSEAAAYLAAATGGNSEINPVKLALAIDLGLMTTADSGWRALLQAIQIAGKYVELDLSACTMNGTEFNPNGAVYGGKGRIVSLVLPDVARSIAVGNANFSYVAFQYFTSLKSVIGANITVIGDYAFYYCTSLTSMSFPSAVSVYNYAFDNCTGLTSVSFPAAVSIGDEAFNNCTSLYSVNIPAAASIGDSAFYYCTGLTSVSFPAA